MRMKVQSRLMQVCFIEIHQDFANKKKKFRFFSNRVVYLYFNKLSEYWLSGRKGHMTLIQSGEINIALLILLINYI